MRVTSAPPSARSTTPVVAEPSPYEIVTLFVGQSGLAVMAGPERYFAGSVRHYPDGWRYNVDFDPPHPQPYPTKEAAAEALIAVSRPSGA